MNKRLYFLFLGVCLVLLFALIRPVYVLDVSFNGYHLLIPLTSTLTVSVQYTHSVSLTKVIDTYSVNRTGIYATEERWQEFLAGQPLNGRFEDGFLVKDMNIYLGREWEYWFIKINGFRLYINGEQVYKQPAEDGILTLEVKEVPAFRVIAR